jgi:hypothetical protein
MEVAITRPGSYNARMPKEKRKVAAMAFRFTEDAAWLLEQCATVSGESKAAILERLIRLEARRVGVKLGDRPTKTGHMEA